MQYNNDHWMSYQLQTLWMLIIYVCKVLCLYTINNIEFVLLVLWTSVFVIFIQFMLDDSYLIFNIYWLVFILYVNEWLVITFGDVQFFCKHRKYCKYFFITYILWFVLNHAHSVWYWLKVSYMVRRDILRRY